MSLVSQALSGMAQPLYEHNMTESAAHINNITVMAFKLGA
jgi:hypothetical protein